MCSVPLCFNRLQGFETQRHRGHREMHFASRHIRQSSRRPEKTYLAFVLGSLSKYYPYRSRSRHQQRMVAPQLAGRVWRIVSADIPTRPTPQNRPLSAATRSVTDSSSLVLVTRWWQNDSHDALKLAKYDRAMHVFRQPRQLRGDFVMLHSVVSRRPLVSRPELETVNVMETEWRCELPLDLPPNQTLNWARPVELQKPSSRLTGREHG